MNAVNLPLAISAFRPSQPLPKFCYGSPERPFEGGQCRIYTLEFQDGMICGVRIARRPDATDTMQVEDERRILNYLSEQGFLWSPKLVGCVMDHDNPISSPFIAYRWIPGTPLVWNETTPNSREKRLNVLDQMAQITLSLMSCTRKDASESFVSHVTRVNDQRITRICSGELRLRVGDCFYYLGLMQEAFEPSMQGPSFLGHNDLAAQNIIINESTSVTGIIDWGFAAEGPFQLSAAMPRFLRHRPGYDGARTQTDRQDFADALRRHAPIELMEAVRYLAELYTSSRSEHFQTLLDAVHSKGAFELLSRTFPVRESSKYELDIRAFLERQVGVNSGLSADDLRRCL